MQDATMALYEKRYWWSKDGLRLHARDYPGADDAPPLICMAGLTRNARDFSALVDRVAGRRRLIALDFRGRGESAYAKDPMTYGPMTYVQDVEALLRELDIARFVAVGTALGGIVAMLLAGPERGRLAGALLNDVGPEIDPVGLSRIRGYVGRGSAYPTWMHAARAVADANGDMYPHQPIEAWLAMAKQLYRLNSAGRIVLDYDMRIAEPFRVPGNEAGPDMWQALAAMEDLPVLIVRGARSDVLSEGVAERMVARLRQATLAVVPDTGHAPTLAEPILDDVFDVWLARTAEPPAV